MPNVIISCGAAKWEGECPVIKYPKRRAVRVTWEQLKEISQVVGFSPINRIEISVDDKQLTYGEWSISPMAKEAT